MKRVRPRKETRLLAEMQFSCAYVSRFTCPEKDKGPATGILALSVRLNPQVHVKPPKNPCRCVCV